MNLSRALDSLVGHLLLWLSALYAILSAIGRIFDVQIFQYLYTQPGIFVPSMFFFLFLISRHLMSLVDSLERFDKIEALISPTYQPDIEATYQVALSLAENPLTQTYYATYLNPDAGLAQPLNTRSYWKKIEKLSISDYRRIVGIYPDKEEFAEARSASLLWLKDHIVRSSKLAGYQLRYLEVETHVVDVAVNDYAAHYAFPFAKQDERGFACNSPDEVRVLRRYFLRLWDDARPVTELIGDSVA